MDGTSAKPRLSKPWKQAWSVLVILVFVWSLPALPSEVKPWKGLVKHVSSTTISVIGVVLVVALLALINLSELERAWARFRHTVTVKRVDGYKPEKEPLLVDPPGWYSTHEVRQNDPKSDQVLVDVAAQQERPLGARANIPDFSSEIKRFEEIDRIYDGSEEADQDVANWIQDVHDKLDAWIPRNAQRFMAGGSWLSSISQIIAAPLTGRTDLADWPVLAGLHQHRDLLRTIVGQ